MLRQIRKKAKQAHEPHMFNAPILDIVSRYGAHNFLMKQSITRSRRADAGKAFSFAIINN